MLFNEVSTFFLNYRIFLLDFKLNETRIYSINAILFALSFLIFRIILNTVLCFYVVRLCMSVRVLELGSLKLFCGIILLAMFCSLLVLNAIWFKGIIGHAMRNYDSDKKTDENTQLKNDMSYQTVTSREGYQSFAQDDNF